MYLPHFFLLAVEHQNSANSPKTLQNGLRRGQTTKEYNKAIKYVDFI